MPDELPASAAPPEPYGPPQRAPLASLAQIKAAVCEVYKLGPRAMDTPARRRRVAWPRQVAMVLAIELTGRSRHDIGAYFHRDHSTVIHAERALARRMFTRPNVAPNVAKVRAAVAAAVAAGAENWRQATSRELAACNAVASFIRLLGEIARRRRKGLPLPKYLFVDTSAVLDASAARRRQDTNFPA